ncbi:FMN-binding protein [Microvirga guangxiensis]|uniref:Na+-transporting NADH:ubiquinone oxidoreductase subunit C n=1 Tax=Microvirga guangxiensis TaxID=549386 RepID=A0A1G5KBT5_9HYPH|nr:FMN-binding protein [Microvirga guangxiensis]SCY97429.1 Na+-transporting NADH:ubiquinone oxidoreductase subunit C [Microvirga guangxiensis]
MADLNPIRLWRQLLSQPNESRAKTLAVAFLVSTLCAVMVTAATVVLRPIQVQNRAMEQQTRLEGLLSEIPGLKDLLGSSEEMTLSTVVVDLRRARAAKDVTPETLESALADSRNWTPLTPQEDIANLGSRADLKQIYLLRGPGNEVGLVVLPVSGTGYGGPIEAMIAIGADMSRVAGLAVLSHNETPGLGGRISEPAWRQQFTDKSIRDSTGGVRLAVARGRATTEFEVDAITGATRTNNAITRMLQFWLGPNGYGPLLDAIGRGDF